ncbi:MAG TPA: protein kinase [Aggregatilineaceae bacterium]|nr:protein kinase [Aggregatilineaceae bacterium]
MNDVLHIRTLGGLSIERGGQLIQGFASRKVEALLVYLAYTGRTYPREVLAELLWEERTQAQSLSNLRVVLSSLRQHVGPYITITRQAVGMSENYWLDAAELNDQLTDVNRQLTQDGFPSPNVLRQLEQALRLYQGDFLAGFYIDSRGFDEWLMPERERWRFRVMEALDVLVGGLQDQHDYGAAIPYAMQLLQLDTLREETHRRLMVLYACAGQRAAALAQYETCCRLLETELDLAPSSETTALYEQIRSGEIGAAENGGGALLHHRFKLGGQLGYGDMSEVFRGTDLHTHQLVAIKVLKSENVSPDLHIIDRFNREVEALRQIDHPNIVKIVTSFVEQERHYLVMEYLGGGSLADLLDQQRVLALERVLNLALDLADGLAHAHRLNIVHRDLKPANVLLTEEGTPRLTDFGMAYLIGQPRLSQSYTLLGTLPYLSPEMINNEEIDGRADIWSFGVMLFEMLAGQRPFDEDTTSATLAAILNKPVPDLEALQPDAPVGLVDLIYRMLEKDRHARISSIRRVGAELETIIQNMSTEQRSSSSSFSLHIPLKHNLYAQLTPFVGREHELAELNKLLTDPNVRLITIHGAGGIGKTRLALECAAQQIEHFANGVHFVPLAMLNTVDSMVSAIANAIRFTFSPIGDNKQQLLTYLRGKNVQHMLLVLDNFEHMMDGALLISEILSIAPRIKILATSRERLNLSGEVVFKLGGMEIPQWEPLEEALKYDAIQLFIQHARRIQPGFELTETDLPLVQHICRRVLGIPLAIVLAAAWVEVLALQEIADEIEQNLDFLETDIRDIPERHRSIRAVFESAWDRLSDTERSVFMKLSIFRGGVKRQIAQYVTGATLGTLTALVNKSLLRRDPDTGRYEAHELLRQYAEEKLEATGQAESARDIHSHYYMSLLCQRESDFRTRSQFDAVKEIETDFENVRAAWSWRVYKNDWEMISLALEGMYLYCLMRGVFEPGEELLRQALIRCASAPSRELLWARILMRRELLLDPHADAQIQIERGLAVARRYDVPHETAFGLHALGYALSSIGDYGGAVDAFEESLKVYRTLNQPFYVGRLLSDIGLFCGVLGQRERSIASFEEALRIHHEIGDDAGVTQVVIRNGINITYGKLL